MLRSARLVIALFALATLFSAPIVVADDNSAGTNVVTEIIDWLTGVLGGGDTTAEGDDEYQPVFLPGG